MADTTNVGKYKGLSINIRTALFIGEAQWIVSTNVGTLHYKTNTSTSCASIGRVLTNSLTH